MKPNLSLWNKSIVIFSACTAVTFSTACSQERSNQSSALLDRNDANNSYFSVGLVTYQNIHRCTATVIKPGVALTAKHCFQLKEIEEKNIRNVALSFPHASEEDKEPLFVRGTQIKKIVFDGPTSDIAYILYSPQATSRLKIDLSLGQSAGEPKKDSAAAIIGFPVEETVSPKFPKVVSKDCVFTGRSDYIRRTPNDSGYDGLLHETTCEGWWGMSGGPALGLESTGQMRVMGVVTHTFHLTPDGDIDGGHIKHDAFGQYIRDVAISPLSQATQLNEMLSADIDKLPLPTFDLDPKTYCGYQDLASLVMEAQAAVDFLKNSESFDPTFWVEAGQADFLQFFRDTIRVQNQKFKADRQTLETDIAWAKDVFSDYDALLDLPSLAKFKTQNIANLGVTSSIKECGDGACTNYGSFVVQVNKESTSAIFSQHHNGTARKIMKAVLGHELGHFILDHYLLKSKNYKTLTEAYEKEGAPKYHLTVDAVGMVLGGVTGTEFAEVLNSFKVNIFGDPRVEADSEDRIMCLTRLR